MKSRYALLPATGLLLLSSINSMGGSGPGGVGEVSGSSGRDLRMWLNTDDLNGSRNHDNVPLATWVDKSGSGLSLAPDGLNGNQGAVFESFGSRRDTHLLQHDGLGNLRPTIQPDDAYLYLKLDETSGSLAADRFNPARNGTYVGDPLKGIKFYGSTATQFDGFNDVVTLPANATLSNLTDSFFISVWIKPDKVSSPSGTLFQRILSSNRQTAGGALSGGWGLGLRNDQVLFTAYGIADYRFTDASFPYSIQPHVWTHLTIEVVGGFLSLKIDNASQFPFFSGVTINPTTGTYAIGNLPGDNQFFDGGIADVIVAEYFDFRFGPENHVDYLARNLPNNHRPWVTLDPSSRQSYRTPSGLSPAITDEVSIYAVSRHPGDRLSEIAPFQTLLASPTSNLLVKYPDKNGKIAFHLGSGPSGGDIDTAPNIVRADFAGSTLSADNEFRALSFLASPNSTWIKENGRLIASGAGSTSTSVTSLDVGSSTFSGSGSPTDLAEIILYNKRLNIAEEIIVENYISAKYNTSTPPFDWYAGKAKSIGDFDDHVIGIANDGTAQHSDSTGGGLRLTTSGFLKTTGQNSLFAGRKTGGLPAKLLPNAIPVALENWWYFDLRSTGTPTGNVTVQFDYTGTGQTIPPEPTHHLLYTPDLFSPFTSVASADRSGNLVDFGPLATGLTGTPLRTGYYAIATAHPSQVAIAGFFPVTSTYNGSNLTLAQQQATLDIAARLATINSQPNDGSVYELDLTNLKLPGSGPTVQSFTAILHGSEFPEINRNLVIRGPRTIYPGRLKINRRFSIGDAFVSMMDLTLEDNTAERGGAISGRHADLQLTRVVFRGNDALGMDAPNGSIFLNHGHQGAFGQKGGDSYSSAPIYESGGNGGFGAGGGGGRNTGGSLYNAANTAGLGGFGASNGIDGLASPASTLFKGSGASAGLGGAVFLYRGTLRLDSCAFVNNTATGGSGGERPLPDKFTNPPTNAAGYGGAIFLWEEAKLTGLTSSIFSNNVAASLNENPGSEPIPAFGENNPTFWGIEVPDDSKFAAVESLTSTLPFVNPLTGVTNPSALWAYQFELYEKSPGGTVIPNYDLLTSAPGNFATDTALAALVTNLSQIDATYNQEPASPLLARLALDARLHLATLNGLRGDAIFQDCIEGPLNPTFTTNLTTDKADLEDAIGHYLAGIEVYINYIKTSTGNANFRNLVPAIPYLQFYYLEPATGEYLPVPSAAGIFWDQTRYRDVALLFELFNDYAKSSSLLIDTLLRRKDPGDEDLASNIAATAITRLQGWNTLVLSAFPEADFSEDRSPGLERSINSLQEAISSLTTTRAYIAGGVNPLGFSDDFLMLIPPSVTPGSASNYQSSFHSFDEFIARIYPGGTPAQVLANAVNARETAEAAQNDFKNSQDEIAAEATDLIANYKERIRSITGTPPGDPTYPIAPNFVVPTGSGTDFLTNSQLWEQTTNIQQARSDITRNAIRISNLNEEINIEIKRNEDEKGINISREALTITYGDMVSKIDDQIAAIEISQNALGGLTDALDPELIAGGPLGLAVLGAKVFNVAAQAGAEVGKLELEGQKEELAVQQMKDENALDNDLLDINSKAFIATRLLEMKELDLDSQDAARNLRQEAARLAGLVEEVETIRKQWEIASNSLEARYYADPGVRLTVGNAFDDARRTFKEAQLWLFFTTRALEYKWNKPFIRAANVSPDGTVWNRDTLFRFRSAHELVTFAGQLAAYDSTEEISQGGSSAAPVDWLSIRNHVFGIDPASPTALTDFRSRLAEFIDPTSGDIVLDFSTLREAPTNFFSGPVFNPNGTIQNNKKGTYLDKINTMRVLVTLDSPIPPSDPQKIGGNLSYGGISYIRNPDVGTFAPGRPDQLVDELSTFTTKTWRFDATAGRWIQRTAPRAQEITIAKAQETTDLNHTAATDPAEFQIVAFQERSVAATNWKLVIESTNVSNQQTFDLNRITDIKIRFAHFTSTRN